MKLPRRGLLLKSTQFMWLQSAAIGFTLAFSCAASTAANSDKTASPADSQEKRPMVALIHSRECPVCAKVRPILKSLESNYDSRVRFVNLDVTDEKSTAEAKVLAKSLHIAPFFNMYKDSFPCVGIFDAQSKTVRELCGFNTKDKYEGYIKRALEKS